MEKLYLLAEGANKRFPKGHEPFQMVTRLLEECGEVASQVNHFEDSGIKRQKHGEPSKQALANEIRQAMVALAQLAAHYGVQEEVRQSIDASLERIRLEGLIQA